MASNPIQSQQPQLSPIPPLPDRPTEGNTWSANALEAHSIIRTVYDQAHRSLQHDGGDALRLQISISNLSQVKVVVASLLTEGADNTFITACLTPILELERALELAAKTATGEELRKVRHLKLVKVQKLRRGPGRSRKIINREFLADALSPHRLISIAELCRILNVDRKTLKNAMAEYGIERKYSALTNMQLDTLMTIFKQLHPDAGLRFAMGFIRRYGLRIQRHRVEESIKRVDSAGRTVRRYRTVTRRTYRVSRPNYLWHMDGYHKLIRYGFVIHGIIDGYCRTIMSLRVSTNNRASTVLKFFKEATTVRGVPSRVRGDRGGENMGVAVWMILHRGQNRASYIWGPSTRNQRIERLWVDVGSQFARRWRVFFRRLEESYHLDVTNEAHRWLLRFLFLKDLNTDARSFVENWNAHPISGPGAQNKSPEDLRLIGQARHGVYVDDSFHGVHPDLIQKYYGVDQGRSLQRPSSHTGAGYTGEQDFDGTDDPQDVEPEEEFMPSTSQEAQIAAEQNHHLRHDAVPVPKGSCPFNSESDLEAFENVLHQLQSDNFTPSIVNLDDFNELEQLKVGKRMVRITLPEQIWQPRVVQWCQGLQVMTLILMQGGQ